MKIEILNSDKHEIDLKIDNLTIAEILRVYLYENGADFAAWRREHPSKPLLFKIKSSDNTVKKAISNAVTAIKKDCNKIVKAVKK
ncbi:MAG: RpoL/Rpb11 RNA polymerase subunit family protein [Nanoarchaeota archaeon]